MSRSSQSKVIDHARRENVSCDNHVTVATPCKGREIHESDIGMPLDAFSPGRFFNRITLEPTLTLGYLLCML